MRKYYYPTKYDAQRTVFRYAQKACEKDFFGVKFLLLRKNFNFYQKTTTSLQSSPSRTPFERSEKQCVVNHA